MRIFFSINPVTGKQSVKKQSVFYEQEILKKILERKVTLVNHETSDDFFPILRPFANFFIRSKFHVALKIY